MKIQKYDIHGNPITDIGSSPADELDPFLEKFKTPKTPDELAKIKAYHHESRIKSREKKKKELELKRAAEDANPRIAARKKADEEYALQRRERLRAESKERQAEFQARYRAERKAAIEAAAQKPEQAMREVIEQARLRDMKEGLPAPTRREAIETAAETAADIIRKKDFIKNNLVTLAKKIPKSKLALAALTGGASVAAQAAEEVFDASSVNEEESDQIRQMVEEEKASKYRKNRPEMRNIFNKADESLRTFGPSDYDLKQMSDKPEFRGLRNKLK